MSLVKPPPIRIQEIPAEMTWAIRSPVLRPDQPLENCHFPMDFAPTAFHLGGYLNEKLVTVASFHSEKDPMAIAKNPFRLRGMATLHEFQGSGVGKALLVQAVEKLIEENCDLLWCNARQNAFDFYLRCGFLLFGDLFEIPGVGPHKVMYKNLG